jgi:glutathione S-transferase
LFNPKISADWKASVLLNLNKKLAWVSGYLGNKTYLMGNIFTVADAYLFTVLRWSAHVGVDLTPWPVLTAYQSRVAQRPKVEQALKDEGLLK